MTEADQLSGEVSWGEAAWAGVKIVCFLLATAAVLYAEFVVGRWMFS